MRRLNLRLIVAMLTVVGVTAALFWFVSRRQLDTEVPKKIVSRHSEKTTYGNIVDAHGVTEDGLPTGHGAITSSDGTNFSWERISYGNPRRARKELQKQLNEAAEIIKREPIFDDKGREVGEKVVAIFPVAKGSSGVFARILWITGSDVGHLESSSLENILKYEKDRNEDLGRRLSYKALQLMAR
jgi:hypothetical protein